MTLLKDEGLIMKDEKKSDKSSFFRIADVLSRFLDDAY